MAECQTVLDQQTEGSGREMCLLRASERAAITSSVLYTCAPRCLGSCSASGDAEASAVAQHYNSLGDRQRTLDGGSSGAFFHWGDNSGYKNYVIGYPDSGRALVYFANSDEGLSIADLVATAFLPDSNDAIQWLDPLRLMTVPHLKMLIE